MNNEKLNTHYNICRFSLKIGQKEPMILLSVAPKTIFASLPTAFCIGHNHRLPYLDFNVFSTSTLILSPRRNLTSWGILELEMLLLLYINYYYHC